MGTSRKVSLFFNLLFVIALFLIVLYMIFRFTETLYSKSFSDKRLVESGVIISELQECLNKYYEYIYFGQFEKAKHSTSLLSRRTNEEYEKIQTILKNSGEFNVIVKQAYKLYGNTYRCYVIIYDKNSSDLSYIAENDKDNMIQVVISLDRFNDNFSIVYDIYDNI